MLEKDIISIVKNYAVFNSEKDDIHGFPHIERVYNLCEQIGKKLGANLLILKISALLHDIGRNKEKIGSSKDNHAEISAEMALKFLNSKNFEISQKKIKEIIHNIKAHSFSNNMIPQTLEAKILSDADKLDALGAIGLFRTISFTIMNKGGIKEVTEHLENKILKLKNQFYLDASKEIAKERQKIILDFYNEISTGNIL